MSLRSCSLRLVQRVRLPRHCAYATQVHPHHLVTKPSAFGQPTLKSHPHLGELTPGIPASEYERRRRQLVEGIPHGSLVVCVAGQVKYMSAATSFARLRTFGTSPASRSQTQRSSSVSPSVRQPSFPFSFSPPNYREGRHAARLPHAPLQHRQRPIQGEMGRRIHALPGRPRPLRRGRSAPARRDRSVEAQAARALVGALRSVESAHEQEVMKASADISARAHAKTMRFAQPGLSEADLQAHFEYMCARSGVQRPAYVPVVASGENALAIHYTRNDHLLRDGELVLLDAGGEYNGYASDITRTFPVNGTFTPPQRELYAALLATQKALVKDLHRRSVSLLRAELGKIGLPCEGTVLERVLYPHYLTHPIGPTSGHLHESGTVERGAPLKEGMVITIEPGVYVPADPRFPKHFHGLGMRIEDEVLVGAEHPVVLSANAPKEIEDVEGTCQGALGWIRAIMILVYSVGHRPTSKEYYHVWWDAKSIRVAKHGFF
ncbi:peptidase M24 [Lactarius pseudohatsudake]|nr:peptidase M24 [Lactarius pseudohatsudake]